MTANYRKKDIFSALRNVGIKPGDTLFIHSNIGFFGIMEGAESQDDYCCAFLESLKEAVGKSGNICVPTFTYSFCNGQDFDPSSTVSKMGMLAEYIRSHSEARRSEDANFSVAVIGPDADGLTKDMPEHSFGAESFWDRLMRMDACICNFNFDAGSTFVHYLEKCLHIPYRFDKSFAGKVLSNGAWESRQYYHFVRHLDKPHWDTDMTKVDYLAREVGLVSQSKLGRGMIIRINTTELYSVLKSAVQKNPYALTVSGTK